MYLSWLWLDWSGKYGVDYLRKPKTSRCAYFDLKLSFFSPVLFTFNLLDYSLRIKKDYNVKFTYNYWKCVLAKPFYKTFHTEKHRFIKKCIKPEKVGCFRHSLLQAGLKFLPLFWQLLIYSFQNKLCFVIWGRKPKKCLPHSERAREKNSVFFHLAVT